MNFALKGGDELVVDRSVTMAWCFEDERTPETDALLARVVETAPLRPLSGRWKSATCCWAPPAASIPPMPSVRSHSASPRCPSLWTRRR